MLDMGSVICGVQTKYIMYMNAGVCMYIHNFVCV